MRRPPSHRGGPGSDGAFDPVSAVKLNSRTRQLAARSVRVEVDRMKFPYGTALHTKTVWSLCQYDADSSNRWQSVVNPYRQDQLTGKESLEDSRPHVKRVVDYT